MFLFKGWLSHVIYESYLTPSRLSEISVKNYKSKARFDTLFMIQNNAESMYEENHGSPLGYNS